MTEQQLTDTIDDATFTAPPQSLDWAAIEHGGDRLRRKRRAGRLSSTALAVTAIVAVGAIAVPLTHSGRSGTVLSTGSTGVGPAYQTAASTGPSAEPSYDPSYDPGLVPVTLPDPAPGFLTRNALSGRVYKQSFLNGPSAPTKIFLLSSQPSTSATAGTLTDAATVNVARAGAAGEGAVGKDAGYPVTGSTVALGCTATVTTENTPEPQVGVFVTVGGFTIAAYGSTSDAAGKAQDPQHLVPGLVTLINSLEGVPSGSCG